MESCEVCAKAAIKYGGNLVSVPIDDIRHWRPRVIWKGTTKKIPDEKPIPLFCASDDSPILMDSDVLINRQHPWARARHSGVPIA